MGLAFEFTIEVIPAAIFTYETTRLMLPLRASTTEAITGDEFHASVVFVFVVLLANFQSQPGRRRLLCSQVQ